MENKNSILLTIKTPTTTIFSEEVNSVTVPTANGYITILPNHENIVSTIDIGITKIIPKVKEGASQEKVIELLSFKGIITVSQNSVTILTQEAEIPTSERLKQLEEAIASAKEKIDSNTELPADLIRAEKELRYHLIHNS